GLARDEEALDRRLLRRAARAGHGREHLGDERGRLLAHHAATHAREVLLDDLTELVAEAAHEHRLHEAAAVRDRAHRHGELERVGGEALPEGDGDGVELVPLAEVREAARRLTGERDARDAPEAEAAEGAIEALAPEGRADLRGADVARIGED